MWQASVDFVRKCYILRYFIRNIDWILIRCVCIGVCTHIETHTPAELCIVDGSESAIWIDWDVDKNRAQKQSITIAGCNLQPIGAQWYLSGAQQTKNYPAIQLSHLCVKITFSTSHPYSLTSVQYYSLLVPLPKTNEHITFTDNDGSKVWKCLKPVIWAEDCVSFAHFGVQRSPY